MCTPRRNDLLHSILLRPNCLSSNRSVYIWQTSEEHSQVHPDKWYLRIGPAVQTRIFAPVCTQGRSYAERTVAVSEKATGHLTTSYSKIFVFQRLIKLYSILHHHYNIFQWLCAYNLLIIRE